MKFIPKTLNFKMGSTGEIIPIILNSFSTISLHEVLLELIKTTDFIVETGSEKVYFECCTKCHGRQRCYYKEYLLHYRGYQPTIIKKDNNGYSLPNSIKNTYKSLAELNIQDGDTINIIYRYPYCDFSYSCFK